MLLQLLFKEQTKANFMLILHLDNEILYELVQDGILGHETGYYYHDIYEESH